MNLALTSDFPSTPNRAVIELIRACGARPRVAWIAPFTAAGRERFPDAKALFESHGFALERCDVDEEPDEEQLRRLDRYDAVYLSGGDPIGFRRNLLRVGLDARLARCLEAGRLVVAASGGAMQLTRNVSLFRLLSATLDDVLRQRGDYDGMGLVDYEILPHLNRFEPPFLETVRRYSEHVPHDVVALADGAALLHAGGGDYACVGPAARFRGGVVAPIEGADSGA